MRRVTSSMCSFSPKASITTITAGCRPAAAGSAMYTGMVPSGVLTWDVLVLMSMRRSISDRRLPNVFRDTMRATTLEERCHEISRAGARAVLRAGLLGDHRGPEHRFDQDDGPGS